MQNIPFHPLAEIFPLIRGKEFVELKADIKDNGVIEPIWMYEGKILDGRNRFRACQETGVNPDFKDYTGDMPAKFVWSLNGTRRHLTPSQKAAAAVSFLPWLEEEAKDRQGKRTDIRAIVPESEIGRARDRAAELTGASARYVSDAKKIKDESPEMFEQVKTGEKTIPEARRELSADKAKPKKKTLPKKSKMNTGRILSAIKDLSNCVVTGDNLYRNATDKQKACLREEIKHAHAFINQLHREATNNESG